MKKIIFFSVCLFISSITLAQDIQKISKTSLESVEDYTKAESSVLEVANYLFKTPVKPETNERVLAKAFIIRWMSGTADHTFSIGENALDATKGNPELFAMYMVGLTKVAIDNSGTKLSDTELHDKAIQLVAEYCSNKANKLKPNKPLKKIIKKMKKS